MDVVILCGHGYYAEESKNSCEMIAGTQDQLKVVNFTMDMAVTDIIKQYEQYIAERSDTGEVIILTDIPGGSPANAALLVKKNHENVRVFSGLNLMMVLSIAMNEPIEKCLVSAKDSIQEL